MLATYGYSAGWYYLRYLVHSFFILRFGSSGYATYDSGVEAVLRDSVFA